MYRRTECYWVGLGGPVSSEQRAVRVLVDATTGTNTGTAANRAIKNDEPDTRQRVVGLDDWCGVPTGIRTRVLALKGPSRRSAIGADPWAISFTVL